MRTTLKRDDNVAGSFKVKGVVRDHKKSVDAYTITDSIAYTLDAQFENGALLEMCTFVGDTPPDTEWASIINGQLEPVKVAPMWQPAKTQRRCVCLAYKMRNPNGELAAITQMLSIQGDTLVSAKIYWCGFPGINRLYVGFKPGMRLRTEELLTAGVQMC